MTASEEPTKVLIVDDDAVFRDQLAHAFAGRGFRVAAAGDAQTALAVARVDTPHCAVVDLRMPGESGLDLVAQLKALHAPMKVVVLTGYGSIATALEAVRRGAHHYLTKPADLDQILQAFEQRAQPAPAPTEVPSLARVEWEHIQRVLTDCSGNVSLAAKRLGIHRRSLQRKLAKYPVAR